MLLLRLTRFLITIAILAVTASRLIGNAQLPPTIAAIFTNPDGSPCEMPCMFGIRPGATGLGDMLVKLRTHPVVSSLKLIESTSASGSEYQLSDKVQSVVVVLDTSNIVQSIHWRNDGCTLPWSPTVADLLYRLGNPSAILVQPYGISTTSYVFSHYRIAVESIRIDSTCKNYVNNERLNPRDVVIGVFLEGSNYFVRYNVAMPWRGFKPAKFYLRPK
jgi:hypothetical protein